jgi:hypothetical protein
MIKVFINEEKALEPSSSELEGPSTMRTDDSHEANINAYIDRYVQDSFAGKSIKHGTTQNKLQEED